jgi:20S proteasome alpha/beta subunit
MGGKGPPLIKRPHPFAPPPLPHQVSPLLLSSPKLGRVDKHIALATSGLGADGRYLVKRARVLAQVGYCSIPVGQTLAGMAAHWSDQVP